MQDHSRTHGRSCGLVGWIQLRAEGAGGTLQAERANRANQQKGVQRPDHLEPRSEDYHLAALERSPLEFRVSVVGRLPKYRDDVRVNYCYLKSLFGHLFLEFACRVGGIERRSLHCDFALLR